MDLRKLYLVGEISSHYLYEVCRKDLRCFNRTLEPARNGPSAVSVDRQIRPHQQSTFFQQTIITRFI